MLPARSPPEGVEALAALAKEGPVLDGVQDALGTELAQSMARFQQRCVHVDPVTNKTVYGENMKKKVRTGWRFWFVCLAFVCGDTSFPFFCVCVCLPSSSPPPRPNTNAGVGGVQAIRGPGGAGERAAAGRGRGGQGGGAAARGGGGGGQAEGGGGGWVMCWRGLNVI